MHVASKTFWCYADRTPRHPQLCCTAARNPRSKFRSVSTIWESTLWGRSHYNVNLQKLRRGVIKKKV
ncbi:hypothetical protein GDO78_019652 [Eleutherodactylus coqui]|uniref:Uncharacterized protein n=1 Tax=Eleutherodactylus coqui TaxID=57060 RepID=A0A8J6AZ28_ELECQ|nr:hypothetical protein GDO78_019652 [Eleutherodactylus coqui]